MGSTYTKESLMGMTIRFPRITRDPICPHNVSFWEILVFWSIRDSICMGPYIVRSLGNL